MFLLFDYVFSIHLSNYLCSTKHKLLNDSICASEPLVYNTDTEIVKLKSNDITSQEVNKSKDMSLKPLVVQEDTRIGIDKDKIFTPILSIKKNIGDVEVLQKNLSEKNNVTEVIKEDEDEDLTKEASCVVPPPRNFNLEEKFDIDNVQKSSTVENPNRYVRVVIYESSKVLIVLLKIIFVFICLRLVIHVIKLIITKDAIIKI